MYSLFALLVLVASASAAGVGNRIIGGTHTTIQQHPHQVSIHQFNDYICTGVLVKADKVLTTAACLTNIARPGAPLVVKLGSADRKQGGTSIMVRSVAIHPEFNPNILDCDLAVITLVQRPRITDTVSPIELVGVGRKPTTGSMMSVTGWGATQPSTKEYSRTLELIRIPVLDIVACEAIYKRAGKVVFDRAFCIGDGFTGPAQGDGGSPVVNVNRQLAGIVSWGRLGSMPGFPTVVTDFSHAVIRRFIDDNTK